MNKMLLLVAFGLAIVTHRAAATEAASDQCEWLLSRNTELYLFLFRDPNTSAATKDKLREGFNRFVFEYWLFRRSNQGKAPLKGSGLLREILHNEAQSERHFGDPAMLLPHFKNGRLHVTLSIAPVRGLELEGLSEETYQNLVREFQKSMFDFQTVFPLTPLPKRPLVRSDFVDAGEERLALEECLAGRNWRWLIASRLPGWFGKPPSYSFDLLTPEAQAYFLPAFMRMCESDVDQAEALANLLVSRIAANTIRAAELRAQLTALQKPCLFAFFKDLQIECKVSASLLGELSKALGIYDGK